MSTQAPLPKNHPLVIAFEKYKATPEYANTRRWALHDAHVDGSLWAAFSAGRESQAELIASMERHGAHLEKARLPTYPDPNCDCPVCAQARAAASPPAGEPTCPSCRSTKVAPTKGNAVGNTMDCLICGSDFTPAAPSAAPPEAAPPETAMWGVFYDNEKRARCAFNIENEAIVKAASANAYAAAAGQAPCWSVKPLYAAPPSAQQAPEKQK